MPQTPDSAISRSGLKHDESSLLHVHLSTEGFSGLTVAESQQERESMGVGLEYEHRERLSHRDLARDDKRREKATEERNAIAKLRGQVIRNRLKVREKRVELRREQAAASQLDASYTSILSAFMGQGASTDPTSLYVAFGKCRKARDTVGPLEDAYNQLEDSLIELEDTLDERESKFYRRYPAISVGSNASISAASSPYVPTTASGSTAEGDEPVQDNDYLVKVGKANIMRERLDGLLIERAQYLEESRIRSPYGIPLEASSEMFLRDFDEIYDKAFEEFQAAENQIQELRRKSSIGLIVLTESASGGESLSSLDESIFPTKEHRRRLSELFPNSKPEYLGDFVSTRARINGWLLHILQHSPLDADLHRAMLHDNTMDDKKWAKLLLKTWSSDDAAMGGPLTLDHSISSDLPTFLSSIQPSKTLLSRNAAEGESGVIAMSSISNASIPASPSTESFSRPPENWDKPNNAHALRVVLSKHSTLPAGEPRPRSPRSDVGRWQTAPRSDHSPLPPIFGLKTSKSYSL
ncbi:MAG: hypothetical protein M1836_003460 [Candelina mexicana]|nr:MAG: hypothetical protein M1836_003460 [Candelina mexicana]